MVAPFPALPVAPGNASTSETSTSKAERDASASQFGAPADPQREPQFARVWKDARITNAGAVNDAPQEIDQIIQTSLQHDPTDIPAGETIAPQAGAVSSSARIKETLTGAKDVATARTPSEFSAVHGAGNIENDEIVQRLPTDAAEDGKRWDPRLTGERVQGAEGRHLRAASPVNSAQDHLRIVNEPMSAGNAASDPSTALAQNGAGKIDFAATLHPLAGEAGPGQQVPAVSVRVFQTLRDQILSATSRGETRLEIRLDPPELGRVLIEFEGKGTHLVRAVISAESPETLTLMRRNIDILQRELDKGGMGNIDFDFGGEYTDPNAKQQRDEEKSLDAPIAVFTSQPDDPGPHTPVEASGRLDRRL